MTLSDENGGLVFCGYTINLTQKSSTDAHGYKKRREDTTHLVNRVHKHAMSKLQGQYLN
jgi:hypothetical protein